MTDVIYVIVCLDLDTKKRTLATEFWTDIKVAELEADAMNFIYTETNTHKFSFVCPLYNSDLRK